MKALLIFPLAIIGWCATLLGLGTLVLLCAKGFIDCPVVASYMVISLLVAKICHWLTGAIEPSANESDSFILDFLGGFGGSSES